MTTTREMKNKAHQEEGTGHGYTGRDDTVHEVVDFKMVTFSLAGKDYGIDIMRVKEIAKFLNFTYVPNTAPYVRGVYNLRGDIISIIDLRLLFNLPAEQKAEGVPENGLILRLENTMLGVIVDSIDRVVGLSSHQIQPPHPIFGDINIRFISGVAEHEDRLYIILDVDRIFRREDEKTPEDDQDADDRRYQESAEIPPAETAREPVETVGEPEVSQKTDGAKDASREGSNVSPESERKLNRDFIREGLATFCAFHISPVNSEWFERRVDEWSEETGRTGKDLQLKNRHDAESFLTPFYSRCTDRFWDADLLGAFGAHLPDLENSVVNVWNPGCGSGRESYSLAVAMKKRYPGKQIKVWAGDTDLLKISNAPNLIVARDEVPADWSDYLVETKAGTTFAQSIKDMIVFEFSDMLNGVMLPRMDCIVCRDVVSFQPLEVQEQSLKVLGDVIKPTGLLILGDRERPSDRTAWDSLSDSISLHRRR